MEKRYVSNKKTVDDFDKCKDFAHEAIQYACFSNCDNTLSRMAGTVNGEYHQNVYINWECSFKGDIDSCKWGWNYQDEIIDMEKVDWSDFTSDIDAINIYYRMLTARDSLWSRIDNYNTGVANGEIKRASQFFLQYRERRYRSRNRSNEKCGIRRILGWWLD